MSIKRIILVIDYDDAEVSQELQDRLHAAGNELSASSDRPIGADGSIITDFADRLEDIVQLVRRAKACGGKDSEDEQ